MHSPIPIDIAGKPADYRMVCLYHRGPMLRPTIARGEPPHHATIGQFTKWNAGGASPGAHAAVARICQQVARLLVRPYRCGTDLGRHLLDYGWAFSDAHKQLPTPASP